MLAEFENSSSELPKHQPADPWAAADLSRDSSQNSWLISYIDILLLLTTLLVMVVALQKSPPEKPVAEATVTSVASLPQPPSTSAPVPSSPPPTPAPERPPQEAMRQEAPLSVVPEPANTTDATPDVDDTIYAASNSASEPAREPESSAEEWEPPDELKEQVEITREAQQIRLEVKDSFLFESGSADLKPQATVILEGLIGLLQRHAGGIAVEGHTDDKPIATARYPSNWELSAARASAVARYLSTHGIAPQRVQAVGYADTRPRSSNDSTEGRARNRRVTLVIYPQPYTAARSSAY
jgi:chemotaxis protein MotB